MVIYRRRQNENQGIELEVAGKYNGLQHSKNADLISSGWLVFFAMKNGLSRKFRETG
jgi:hypothetical protein